MNMIKPSKMAIFAMSEIKYLLKTMVVPGMDSMMVLATDRMPSRNLMLFSVLKARKIRSRRKIRLLLINAIAIVEK